MYSTTDFRRGLKIEIGGGVRYLLMVITAGAVIPAFFRFLPQSSSKKRAKKKVKKHRR